MKTEKYLKKPDGSDPVRESQGGDCRRDARTYRRAEACLYERWDGSGGSGRSRCERDGGSGGGGEPAGRHLPAQDGLGNDWLDCCP